MNCTEEKDKLCSSIIKGKSILLHSVGLTLQKKNKKKAKFKTSVLKAVLYDCQHFIPTRERFTQYPPQNHPYFPYISCPLCIPRTLYWRSAWILILIESNMLETEKLRKKCITSALDSPPAIIYVVH
jgi:hypothetical protein